MTINIYCTNCFKKDKEYKINLRFEGNVLILECLHCGDTLVKDLLKEEGK